MKLRSAPAAVRFYERSGFRVGYLVSLCALLSLCTTILRVSLRPGSQGACDLQQSQGPQLAVRDRRWLAAPVVRAGENHLPSWPGRDQVLTASVGCPLCAGCGATV